MVKLWRWRTFKGSGGATGAPYLCELDITERKQDQEALRLSKVGTGVSFKVSPPSILRRARADSALQPGGDGLPQGVSRKSERISGAGHGKSIGLTDSVAVRRMSDGGHPAGRTGRPRKEMSSNGLTDPSGTWCLVGPPSVMPPAPSSARSTC